MMKKLFQTVLVIVFLFFNVNLKAQNASITSASTTSPILCNGDLTGISVGVDNTTGNLTPTTYQLKVFKASTVGPSSVVLPIFSSSQFSSAVVTATGLDSGFYYLLLVDSVAFSSVPALNPLVNFFSLSDFNNIVFIGTINDFNNIKTLKDLKVARDPYRRYR